MKPRLCLLLALLATPAVAVDMSPRSAPEAAFEQRTVQLARACLAGCEALADLSKAIDRCKAAGNKFVSGP